MNMTVSFLENAQRICAAFQESSRRFSVNFGEIYVITIDPSADTAVLGRAVLGKTLLGKQ